MIVLQINRIFKNENGLISDCRIVNVSQILKGEHRSSDFYFGKFQMLENPKHNIQAGTYKVKKRHTKRLGDHLILGNVAGRTYILIHAGANKDDSKGCLMPGIISDYKEGLIKESRSILDIILMSNLDYISIFDNGFNYKYYKLNNLV